MRFFIFDISVDLCDFSIFEQIVDANISITSSIGNQRIFGCEFGDHNLALLPDGRLYSKFLLEWHFLYNSALRQFY